jgi:vacuolar protein sorting-associated protein 13A/C
MQIKMASPSGDSDSYYFVGLSYAEGLGKVGITESAESRLTYLQYKLTKVITIAPRFIVKNNFQYAIKVRQHGTQKVLNLAAGQRLPVHELRDRDREREPVQLSIAFDEANLKW